MMRDDSNNTKPSPDNSSNAQPDASEDQKSREDQRRASLEEQARMHSEWRAESEDARQGFAELLEKLAQQNRDRDDVRFRARDVELSVSRVPSWSRGGFVLALGVGLAMAAAGWGVGKARAGGSGTSGAPAFPTRPPGSLPGGREE